MVSIKSFVEKLKRIGIEVTLQGNLPWIYLTSINGIPVLEKFRANHGFTAFFHSVKGVTWSDRRKVFKLIRSYCNDENSNDQRIRA